jgi:hypothetical protein
MPAATTRKISEPWTWQIESPATWLCPADRDQFRAAVAAELGDHVARAIRAAFRTFYRPLQISNPTVGGSSKLTAGKPILASK